MLGQVVRDKAAYGRTLGFTLVEALVTVSILGILLAVAAPSFVDWIATQRVKSSASELLTDIRFARGEAIKRNARTVIAFRNVSDVQTCYTVHTQYTSTGPCRCDYGIGVSCNLDFESGVDGQKMELVELKTVPIPAASKVTIIATRNVRFVGATGIQEAPLSTDPDVTFAADIDGGSSRKLRVVANALGRAFICAPSGSKLIGYPVCV